MAKKPRVRPRAERREAVRASAKRTALSERLFQLEQGGAPERPLAVASAAVIEAQAESVACPLCQGRQEVAEHVAVTLAGARLREVRLRCRMCGSRRSLWFRISAALPN